MTSTYKITNHVLEKIDLTSSFIFYYKCYTTSSSNLEKRPTSKKLYTNDSQDVYRKRDTKKKSRREWRRGLTLIRIVLHHNKNFRGTHPKKEINGKNRARSGVTTVLP
jgi:hypothetical protein